MELQETTPNRWGILIRLLATLYVLVSIAMMVFLDKRFLGFLSLGIGLCCYCIYEIAVGCIFTTPTGQTPNLIRKTRTWVENPSFIPSPPIDRPIDRLKASMIAPSLKMQMMVPKLEVIGESRELIFCNDRETGQKSNMTTSTSITI